MQVTYIKVADLSKHCQHFYAADERQLAQLVKSIREIGIQAPLIVTKSHVIICGVQRWLAATEAGLEEVPVIISEVSEEDELFHMVEGNRQRVKTMSDFFAEIEVLKSHFGKKQGTRTDLTEDGQKHNTRKLIAEHTGLSEGNVYKLEKINELHPDMFALLDKKEVSINEAYERAKGTVPKQKGSHPEQGLDEMLKYECPYCQKRF